MHLQLLIDDLHQIAESTPKKSSPDYQKASNVGRVVGDFQLGTNARKKQFTDEKRFLEK